MSALTASAAEWHPSWHPKSTHASPISSPPQPSCKGRATGKGAEQDQDEVARRLVDRLIEARGTMQHLQPHQREVLASGLVPLMRMCREAVAQVNDGDDITTLEQLVDVMAVEGAGAQEQEETILQGDIPDPDEDLRVDLTDMFVYTIDGPEAKTFDDGISIEHYPDGSQRVWVHIADVARYVWEGTPLYHQARARQLSCYVLPREISVKMLSDRLSEDVCSLREGELCCCVSVGMLVGDPGGMPGWGPASDVIIMPSTVRITHRLTFDQVDDIIEAAREDHLVGGGYGLLGGGDYAGFGRQVAGDMHTLWTLAEGRRRYRAGRSCYNNDGGQYNSGDVCVEINPDTQDSWEARVVKEDITTGAQVLNREMMTLAGEAVAWLGANSPDLGLPYHTHEPLCRQFRTGRCRRDDTCTYVHRPCPDREACQDTTCRLGHGAFWRLKASEAAYHSVRTGIAPVPGRHCALGLSCYVQWTSPIRKCSHLLVLYQLKNWMRNQAAGVRGGAGLQSGEKLVHDITEGEAMRQAITAFRNTAKTYWVYEFLRRESRRAKPDGLQYTALVRRHGHFKTTEGAAGYETSVMLLELGETVTYLDAIMRSKGDRLAVTVHGADPLAQTVDVTVQKAMPMPGRSDMYPFGSP